jgi:hypothetical protein
MPAKIMSLARSAAKKPGDPPTSVLGFIGDQVADAFGYSSVSDAANAAASAIGLGQAPVGDVTGFFSGLADNVGDAVSNASMADTLSQTQVFDAVDIANMSDAEFSAFSGHAAADPGAVQGQDAVFGPPTPSTATTPDVSGGPGLPVVSPAQTVSLENPFPQMTTETLLDATSSDYTAEELANLTGVSVEQAQEYLDSRYPKPVDVLPTIAETVQGTVSPDYTAEELANLTGVSIGQAQEYLNSQYSQLT